MSEFIKWTYFCGCMYFCTHETSAQDQKFTPVKPTATCAAKSVDSLIIYIYICILDCSLRLQWRSYHPVTTANTAIARVLMFVSMFVSASGTQILHASFQTHVSLKYIYLLYPLRTYQILTAPSYVTTWDRHHSRRLCEFSLSGAVAVERHQSVYARRPIR